MKRIDRVEALQLTASAIKRQLGAAFDRGRMQRLLFHGTNAVEMIINAAVGNAFLPLKSGNRTGAIHGEGTCFARDPTPHLRRAAQQPVLSCVPDHVQTSETETTRAVGLQRCGANAPQVIVHSAIVSRVHVWVMCARSVRRDLRLK
jgi:hypothetical protein